MNALSRILATNQAERRRAARGRGFPLTWEVGSRWGARCPRTRQLRRGAAKHGPTWVIRNWAVGRKPEIVACEFCATPTQLKAIRYAAAHGGRAEGFRR